MMPSKESSAAQRATQATKPDPAKPESAKPESAKPEPNKGEPAEARSATSAATNMAGDAAEATRETGEQAMAIGRAAAAHGLGWQEEAMRFMSLRIERQMDHVGAVMACRSPVELLEVESRFAVQSFQDYLDETYRMLERAVDFGSGAVGARSGQPTQTTA